MIDAKCFHEMIEEHRAAGKPPIIECSWEEIARQFRDEERLCRFGKDNGLAFALVVTKWFRKCFAMEAPNVIDIDQFLIDPAKPGST